jgi:hypothetical protein
MGLAITLFFTQGGFSKKQKGENGASIAKRFGIFAFRFLVKILATK